MKLFFRSLIAAVAVIGTLLAQPVFGQASLVPRSIRLVVPFPPGNASDFQARLLAEQLHRATGSTVVVDNRPGASGAIALQHVAAAKPDGSTLLVSSTSPVVITPAIKKLLPYDTERDFAPVALLGFNDVVLVAGPSQAATTLPELMAQAARQPDGLTYATIGAGTLGHLVMELVTARAQVRMRHVPYKGSGQAYTDLIGGETSVMADGLPQALSQIKAGKFKPLAVFSKVRSPFLNNVPTVNEANLPGLRNVEIVGWTGVLAPAGTPREVVAALNTEILRIFGSTEVKSILAAQSLQPFASHTPQEFASYIRAELGNWRAMAKAAGVESSE